MKILITGGSGLVGSRFAELTQNNHEVITPSSSDSNITEITQIDKFLEDKKPDAVLNFAALTNVDGAEGEKDDKEGLVYKLNAIAPHDLAMICKKLRIYLLHISTDYVFDGKKEEGPYKEDDLPNPVNWYGTTKLWGEQNVLGIDPTFCVARIEMPYSANYDKKSDFARFFLQALKDGKEVKAVSDQKITPIFVDDCCNALVKILETRTTGIFHLASTDPTSPYDFAVMLAKQFNLDASLISGVGFEEFNSGRKASRPKNSWLSTQKFTEKFGPGILYTNEESIKSFKSLL